MNGWILACLATMAVALVAMAAGQVILALMAVRMARQATETLQDFRRDVGPVVEKFRRVADDASRATAIVLAQAERVDKIVGSSTQRIDEMLTLVNDALLRPLRNGSALLAGVRAAFEIFSRGKAARRRRGREDEDALFIG